MVMGVVEEGAIGEFGDSMRGYAQRQGSTKSSLSPASALTVNISHRAEMHGGVYKIRSDSAPSGVHHELQIKPTPKHRLLARKFLNRSCYY
jgi:hypothetical protein